MKSLKAPLIITLSVFITAFTFLSIYNWHKDNFVYLPNVSSTIKSNGITTLYTTSGDTYVIEY